MLRSPYGDIEVVICRAGTPDADGKPYLGQYESASRRITVSQANMTRETAWQTLYHEWFHVVTIDSGLDHTIGEQTMESLCDCFGAALHWFIEHNSPPPGRKADRSRA